MPVPPRNPFRKFTCQQCSWSEVTYQPSDCIFGIDVCPKCRDENVKMSAANPIEAAASFPLEFARHLLK